MVSRVCFLMLGYKILLLLLVVGVLLDDLGESLVFLLEQSKGVFLLGQLVLLLEHLVGQQGFLGPVL